MNIERRIQALETMVAEIHAVLVQGKPPAAPGLSDYRRAIEAMLDGNKKPLDDYLRRGGKIPKAETVYPDIARGRES